MVELETGDLGIIILLSPEVIYLVDVFRETFEDSTGTALTKHELFIGGELLTGG